MSALSPELQSRCQVFRERVVIPALNATLQVLPAEPKRLEGLDFTTACLDEIGVVARETYETLLLASGKRPESTLVCLGTPGADSDNVLASLREQHLTGDPDPSFVYVEHRAAAGFEDHPADCEHCWELANPALDVGRELLRDASDLCVEYRAAYLDKSGYPDQDAIRAAAEELLTVKPHLARARGDAGQGARPDAGDEFSLGTALRSAAS